MWKCHPSLCSTGVALVDCECRIESLRPPTDNLISSFRVRGRFKRLQKDLFVPPWFRIPDDGISEEEDEGVAAAAADEALEEPDSAKRRAFEIDVRDVDTPTNAPPNDATPSDAAVFLSPSQMHERKSASTSIDKWSSNTMVDPRSTTLIKSSKTGQLKQFVSTPSVVDASGDVGADEMGEGGGEGKAERGVSGDTNRTIANCPSTTLRSHSHDFRVTVHRISDLLEDQRGPPPQRDPLKLERGMAELLQLPNYESDLDEAIVLDVFVAAARWAADTPFQPLLATLFLHLVQRLHVQIEENPSFENIMETLHGHVYNESFLDVFQEGQIVDIIDYLGTAVLKPFKLYRLYALISFVHEADDNPDMIKKSGKKVHDVYLRYESSASVIVPDVNVLPPVVASSNAPSGSNSVVGTDVNVHADTLAIGSFSSDTDAAFETETNVANVDAVFDANDNAQLDTIQLERKQAGARGSATSIGSRRSFIGGPRRPSIGLRGRKTTNWSKHRSSEAEEQFPPLPLPPCIPPLCEGIPLELFVANLAMEEEKERARREEEERYALLHPKILTSAEHLDQMIDTLPAEELVGLVTSNVASTLKPVGETLGEDLKQQEGVWDQAVEKLDAELRTREEGGGERREVDNRSVKSKKSAKSAKSKKGKK